MIKPTREQLDASKRLFDKFAKELEVKNLTIVPEHQTFVGDVGCLPAPVAEIRLALILLVQGLAGVMTDSDRHQIYSSYMLLDSFVETPLLDGLVKLYDTAMSGSEEAAKELVWQTRHMMSKQRIRELLDYEYASDINEKRFTETDMDEMSIEEFEAAIKKVRRHIKNKEV